MLRKIIVIPLLALMFFTSIKAQSKKDTIPTFFGVSYIPALNWKIFNITNDDGKFLAYKFYQNAQSSIEGNFSINKIGMRLGLSANVENNLIGKINKFSGYISLKNYWLKIQTSKLSGTVTWSGDLPPGEIRFLQRFDFTNSYFSVEILKTSKAYKKMAGGPEMNKILGTYWGIGFTSIGIPLKLSTLTTPGGREHQIFGIPAYDTLFTAKFYTVCMGFNLLRQLSQTGGKISVIPGRPAKRFAMYASTQDKLGFGTGKISDYGVSMAEALNSGHTLVSSKGFTTLVHGTTSVGFRYLINARPMFFIFACGYDFEYASIMNFGGAADNSTDLGYDSNFFYITHGVSFKIYMSWIGNK